jgi:hypothetical protein
MSLMHGQVSKQAARGRVALNEPNQSSGVFVVSNHRQSMGVDGKSTIGIDSLVHCTVGGEQ